MGEVFEQLTFAQQWPKQFFAIIAVTRPQDVVMRARDISDRVDLQEPQATYGPHDIDWSTWVFGQIIGMQPHSPGSAIVDLQSGCHGKLM
ncbi:hypothetical protein [Roseovarius phycicola]|uniref:Uncharacterized protein n=1 Tax=Roseovarius phycicola TaxID=3080976 RepID=A0ABZ2HM35_9RHOB